MSQLRVGIFGAGAIGGYLGVRLSAAGVPVTLVGRSDLVDAKDRLVAYDREGMSYRPTDSLQVTTQPAALTDVDLCLLTVKSGDTAAAAATLRKHLRFDVPVISLQNGLQNVPTLHEELSQPIVPGMVTYNVRREGLSTFRKATTGPTLIGMPTGLAQERTRAFVAASTEAGEPVGIHPTIEGVQVAKLLLNLNNGLCALTGLSIADSLGNRDLRRCFSLCMQEGLAVVGRAGLPVARIGVLSPGLVAQVLRLPNVIFFQLARSMMAIDPQARSSSTGGAAPRSTT
jgi:2-dehydropantoate 2-reductase